MSEPQTPPPTQPPDAPFSGEPRRLGGAGCSRPLLLGCGGLVVLLGIAAIVFLVKARDLLGWTIRQIETQVVTALPADVTAEERFRLERGFDAALERIGAGEVEPPALFALQRQLRRATERAGEGTLDREAVLDLLSALERVGGLLADPEPEDRGEARGRDSGVGRSP
jgi:hypothetical protein